MSLRFMGPVGWPRGDRTPGADPLAAYRVEGRHLLLTHKGRTAIDLAVRALELRPGDEVLVPAYSAHCEVDILQRHGLKPVFYPVRGMCELDLEDMLRRDLPRVRALYVIHFFGFPQQAVRWLAAARARGWAIIEDCAHALFSREGDQLLGTRGDLAIFSFQKTLGLPDGGALLANRAFRALPPHLPAMPGMRVAADAARQWLLGFAPPLLLRAANRLALRAQARAGQSDQPETFREVMRDRGPSAWTAGLLARIDPGAIVQAQRVNFQRLLDGCPRTGALRPLFQLLPAGVNPLFFPVWCRQRAALQRFLAGRGVVSYRWWGRPHGRVDLSCFPETRDLKDHVLTLPVHYQLADGSTPAMIDALTSWENEERT